MADAQKPSNERNGCFLDAQWFCKVCDGEIPNGHTNDCDIWKLEKNHADFIANEHRAVLTDRGYLHAQVEALRANLDALIVQRDEWARKWHAVRAELAELKHPDMNGIVKSMNTDLPGNPP